MTSDDADSREDPEDRQIGQKAGNSTFRHDLDRVVVQVWDSCRGAVTSRFGVRSFYQSGTQTEERVIAGNIQPGAEHLETFPGRGFAKIEGGCGAIQNRLWKDEVQEHRQQREQNQCPRSADCDRQQDAGRETDPGPAGETQQQRRHPEGCHRQSPQQTAPVAREENVAKKQ